mmetsp:Transcript_30896/g.59644  ORF Transcript_30896/g.59644 Transcript_30896/m.59644 type:complete len:201 (+) Transcript_30896:710-1312(+)
MIGGLPVSSSTPTSSKTSGTTCFISLTITSSLVCPHFENTMIVCRNASWPKFALNRLYTSLFSRPHLPQGKSKRNASTPVSLMLATGINRFSMSAGLTPDSRNPALSKRRYLVFSSSLTAKEVSWVTVAMPAETSKAALPMMVLHVSLLPLPAAPIASNVTNSSSSPACMTVRGLRDSLPFLLGAAEKCLTPLVRCRLND